MAAVTTKRHAATSSGTSQDYATKVARGTARAFAVSLTGAEIAALDAHRAALGLTRTQYVREALAAFQATR